MKVSTNEFEGLVPGGRITFYGRERELTQVGEIRQVIAGPSKGERFRMVWARQTPTSVISFIVNEAA